MTRVDSNDILRQSDGSLPGVNYRETTSSPRGVRFAEVNKPMWDALNCVRSLGRCQVSVQQSKSSLRWSRGRGAEDPCW